MQNNLSRRTLPPGVQDDIVFGILWIRVGLFKSVKPSPTAIKVNIQFWGEASPAVTYTSQPNPTPLQYDIRCPVTFFERYLHDMKKNLKIQVENIGNVFVDLTTYLKKNITLSSKSPFEHFKGFFEVIAKNNKKAGSLQLQFCANFNPQIALRECEEDQKQQNCPATKQNNCQCRGECKCRPNKVTALDVIALQNPDLFRDFYQQSKIKVSPKKHIQFETNNDNRIPNSLNNMPNKANFDPNKYAEPIGTPKVRQNFPTVEKILTYSNLKLKKQQEAPLNKESSRPISIKEHLVSEPASGNILNLPTGVSKQQLLSEQISKPTGIFGNQKNISEKQLKKTDDQRPVSIIPVLQNRAQGNLSDVSEVQKMDESVSVQAQKEILSRVVNLNEELEKERKSPKKSAYREQEQIFRPKLIETQDIRTNPASVPILPNFAQSYGRVGRKSSNLLLNVVVQLQTSTVSFQKNQKFILSYRPYGQKQSVRTGPLFPQNLVMMFPVGEPQVAKMNKIPFILQFWGANDGSLLGVIKLSLAKIHKGFILQGRLNELAIKTSLLPTVIHKGIHKITDLLQKTVGQCYFSAHLGTSAQIQTYMNNPAFQNTSIQQQPLIAPLQKEQVIFPQPKQSIEKKKGTLQDFTSLLQIIDTNTNQELARHLFDFINKKIADSQQFQDFLQKLPYKGGDIFYFLTFGGSSKQMNCNQLVQAFDDYKRVKQAYLAHAAKTVKSLSNSQIAQIVQKIKEKTNFGMISKEKLIQILQDPKFDLIKSFIGEINDSSSLIQWFNSAGKMPLKQVKLKQTLSRPYIEQIFLRQILNSFEIIQRIINSKTEQNEIPLVSFQKQFQTKKSQNLSIWFWIQLLEIIYESFGQEFDRFSTVNSALVYNWLALKHRERNQESAEVNENHILQTINQNQQINKQTIENEPKQQPKIIYAEPQKQPQIKNPTIIIDEPNKENKEINNSLEKQKENESNIKQKQKLIQHKFVISLQQIQLQQDSSGQCTIFYRFPFQQEQIPSRKFQLLREKHKYKLACSGTHKFTINQAIQQYLGESTLSVRVVIGKESEFYGDLHSEELVTNGSQYRVLPLFSASRQGMVGKVKIRIQYSQELAQQPNLGRETIRDVFLPKNGFLNFDLATTVDQNRLRQQFNFKDQFYIQISLDLFGENSTLAPHFPPFHSKLYSDFSSELTLSGSIKLTLSQQVLQHLRGGSCHARMHAIYYSKEKASYQRKDLLVASFKAPLFAVIREQGLKGDYAFKNRLGMFVSLAHCSIKYEKDARMQERGGQNNQSRQNFWLVIDFSEIINFESDLGWVKFEIISKGKRHTTQKALIKDIGIFTLQSKCLCLQMGQEQFSQTKILAVNVIAGSEKYGIDINLRPIAKSLGRQKYCVNSHYFLVIDDQSRCKKIRIGAKIYAFRGHASLGTFVQNLSKYTVRNDELVQQKEIEYQQRLQDFRKSLKMSGKAFQQALSQFLDKRKKQRLPIQFFMSKIHSNLDLTPILTFNQSDIELIAQELPSEIDQRLLTEYIQQNGIKLLNLRQQFLQRYSFSKLNQTRLDQNVQYLNLNQEIDLLVFVSKIRVQAQQIEENTSPQKISHGQRMVRASIMRGYNFHLLYNGIMPNARVALPQIGLETELVERSSQPIFNEHINFSPTIDLRRVRIQAYHQPSEDAEAILIGEGSLSIVQAISTKELPFSKVIRVVLTSSMSNRMQAAIDIKVQVGQRNEVEREKSYSEIDESIGDSRIQQAMQRINRMNDFRKKVALFESSDED